MSSYGYRLERSITAIECAPDGRTSLRNLSPGTVVLVSAAEAPARMVRVVGDNATEYLVFAQDLEERSTSVAVDLRKPAAAVAAASSAGCYWAC